MHIRKTGSILIIFSLNMSNLDVRSDEVCKTEKKNRIVVYANEVRLQDLLPGNELVFRV